MQIGDDAPGGATKLEAGGEMDAVAEVAVGHIRRTAARGHPRDRQRRRQNSLTEHRPDGGIRKQPRPLETRRP